MAHLLRHLFDTTGFMPRRLCGTWSAEMIALHRVSDIAIGTAYLAIPAILLFFLWHRGQIMRDFSGMIAVFGLFITSCGASHFLDSMMFERPLYRLAGLVKVVTAVSAWGSVILLLRLVPRIARLRSQEQMEVEVWDRTCDLRRVNAELQQVNGTLKATVEEKRRLTTELAERDKRKNQWLAMLAHELRNPLAPIINAISIMRFGGSQDTVMERQRQIVERQVEHMRRIIEDLLDVSRITQGKIELNVRHLALCDVIDHALESSQPGIAAKEHRVALELPNQKILVNGDAVRLEQIVINLLTNATKYTPPRGEIKLSLRREPNGWATITVRDSGVGIPEEFLPRVFDLFMQEDASLDRREGGLGIGLTLCKALVEQHRGRIECYSSGRGQGAEFQIWLPTVETELVDVEVIERPSGDNLFASESTMILIVEDNVDSAETLADLCRLWGHETAISHDGWEAEQQAREHGFDTVLLDIGLPGMDGYEVARRLRQIPGTREALFICLSGYGTENLKSDWRQAGFDMHIVKPMRPEELRRILAGESIPDNIG